MRTGTTAVVAPASSLGTSKRAVLKGVVLGAAVAAALVTVAGRAAWGATDTWTGAAGANWSAGGNWVGGVAPAAGDGLVFAGGTQLANTNDFGVNTSFGGITFDATAGAFTLGGNSVVVTGDVVNNSASAQAINLTTVPVTVNGNFTYTTGGVVVDGGTVNVSTPGGGALALGQVTLGAAAQSANVSTLNINNSVSASGLTVQTNNASANTINIASGQTFTVGGNVYVGTPVAATGQGTIRTNVNFTGGGNLSVTGGNFYVGLGSQNYGGGDHNNANVDMTGLGGFSYTGGGNFGVGWQTRPEGFLKLTPGTNTIVASQVQVGNSGITGTGNSPNNNGGMPVLYLGAGTNVIRTNTLNAGDVKGSGSIDWVTAGSGTVTITGQDGVGRTNIKVADSRSGGGTNSPSNILLAGHTANVLADTVTVGRLAATGSPNLTGGGLPANVVTFDTGTFDANTVVLGANVSGASANGASGEFRLGGDAPNNTATGVLTVNTAFYLGNDANTTTSSPTNALFTVNGGTANIKADIQVVARDDRSIDSNRLTLAGGTLNMNGHNVGSAAVPLTRVDLSGGTLANAAAVYADTINVTAPLSVTGGTTLALSRVASSNATLNNNTGSPLALPSGVTVAGGAGGSAGVVNGDVSAAAGSRITPGTAADAGVLQFNNSLSLGDGSAVRFKLSSDPNSGNDVVNVNGNLSLSGAVSFEIGALGTGATIGQTYTLLNYNGSLTGGDGDVAIVGPGSRKTFTLVPTATTANHIEVLVGGTDPLSLTYVGNGGSTWQAVTGPVTWTDGSASPQKFYNQDTVTFDDSSTNAADVQLVGQLTSGGVTVSANRDYKFAGTGSLTGTTGLTKMLGGTLVVATNNTNSGVTDIEEGTVRVGDGGTSGSLGSGAITDNANLAFNRSDSVTVANAISGSGNLSVENGTVTLTGANTYNGTTTVKSGALLRAGTASALGANGGGAVTVESGGTFDINGVTTQTANFDGKVFNIAGAGVSDGAGGTLGALNNSSSTTQLYAFENVKLTDDALVHGSRMDVGRTATGGTLDLNGKTLTTDMSGTQPVFAILDGTTVTAGNITVKGGGLDLERSLVMDNSGGVVTFNPGTVLQSYQMTDGAVTRPMVFKGNNTIGSGSTTAAVVNSPMRLDGSVTLQSVASGVPNAANNPLELKGAISGVGGITKVGTNSVTLSGVQTYAGATAVNGGTLVVGGSSTGSASLSVADGAVVQTTAGTVETLRYGGLNLNATGKLDINDDKLVIGGAVSPATVLGYIQRGYAGGAWNGNGLMSTSAQGSSIRGLGWAVVDGTGITSWGSATGLAPTDVVVRMTYVGDLNLDGVVGADDFALLDRGFAGHLTGWVNGDVNYDGVVDVNDYLAVDTAYGQQGGALSPDFLAQRESEFGSAYVQSLVAAVPEPGTLGVVGGLAVAGLVRRRRRNG